MAEDVRNATNDQSLPTGGMLILLTLVTCGIYGYFWLYKVGQEMQQPLVQRNLPGEDKGILYLILAIFFLAIVDYCLIQNDLNMLADPTSVAPQQPPVQ